MESPLSGVNKPLQPSINKGLLFTLIDWSERPRILILSAGRLVGIQRKWTD